MPPTRRRAEPFVRARVKALKADGYRKIVLAGHSWGGWEMMLAAKDNADVDALILSSPAAFGSKTTRFGPSVPTHSFTSRGEACQRLFGPVALESD